MTVSCYNRPVRCHLSSGVERIHGKDEVVGSNPTGGSMHLKTDTHSAIIVLVITKEKGDIAICNAIKHFMMSDYEVCVPIGDKRAYDLVVEKQNILQKVQVKYAGIYASGKCKVGLRTTGGNQSFHTAKKYSADSFDVLYVYTERGDSFVLPWIEVVARNELTIEHLKYSKYKVTQG